MKTYKVIAKMYTTLVCEIDAADVDDAWRIAKYLDGSEFTELPDADWDVYDVQEVKQ